MTFCSRSLAASTMSPTLMAVTSGKRSASAWTSFASRAGSVPFGYSSVTSTRCGAPASVFGENTMTKLMASNSQSILRKLAMLGFDIAAEHVDGDGVADLQARALGDLGVEGDERRAGVAGSATSSPAAMVEPRGSVVGIGQAAVAGEHPAAIGRGLDLLHRHAVDRHDAAAQHRRVGELGVGLDGVRRVAEGGEVVARRRRGSNRRERRPRCCPSNSAMQRAIDQRDGDEEAEAQARARRRPERAIEPGPAMLASASASDGGLVRRKLCGERLQQPAEAEQQDERRRRCRRRSRR